VVVHRRAWIGEGRDGVALGVLQNVFDVMVNARRPPVGEDVGADLADSRLEENELAIVDLAADRIAQKLDGLVQEVQSFVKPAEVGTELKWLLGTRSLRSQ